MQTDTEVMLYSEDAEQATLGSCLVAEQFLENVARLTPDHYYFVRNRYIFEVLQELHDRRVAIDYLTVVEKLRERGQLADIGGAAYLTLLINNTPTHIHANIYSDIVDRMYYRRQLMDMATGIGRVALDNTIDKTEIKRQVEEIYYSVETTADTSEAITMSSLSDEFFDDVEYRYQHQTEPDGVPTYFKDIDTALGGGPQKGDIVILAARTGFGKTALALNIAKREAEQGIPVAFESVEMRPKQLYGRLAAIEASIDSQKFRSGNLSNDEWDRFTEASGKLKGLPIFYHKAYTSSYTSIGANLRKLKRIHDIQVAFVDYLQLLAIGDPKYKVAEIGVISRYFKVLAGELDIPIWMLCQLNRDVEKRGDKRPMLSDLRDSGTLEQDADTVIFIYRDEIYNPNSPDKGKSEIIAAKNRNGPLGTIWLGYDQKYTRFVDIESVNINDMLHPF
jgi:replicative DNA helicase